MKHLQGAKKWTKGMVAHVETEQGQRQVTVIKVGKFMVDVDANHPFAGKELTFEVKIEDIREATAEEIQHGHAHGVGGLHLRLAFDESRLWAAGRDSSLGEKKEFSS